MNGEGEEEKLENERNEFKKRQEKKHLPPIDNLINIYDLQQLAKRMLPKYLWDYYISGAEDEMTIRDNERAFQRVWLRPRVLVDVTKVDTSTVLLGTQISLPLYFSATALTKLAHPQGDLAIGNVATNVNIPQMFPTLASCTIEELAAKVPLPTNQTRYFQLYLNRDRSVVKKTLERAEEAGFGAICVTVDAPVIGRRERDIRNRLGGGVKLTSPRAAPLQTSSQHKSNNQNTGSALIDPSFDWDNLEWLRSATNLPLVLKGVQSGEDAVEAARRGVSAVIISNHGGRQLDTARSSLVVLLEVVEMLKSVGLYERIEVWMDGGVRRGTDIFKAIAIGAKAVGIGRPVLYGLACYGDVGVEKVIEMLRDELEVCMRNMGVCAIRDINSSYVQTRSLAVHGGSSPIHYARDSSFSPLVCKL
jgi:L-lactate dehydrogenase (cytochrome)